MDRNCGKKINKNRINFMVTFKNALGHCVDVQFSGDCTCPSQGLLKIWTEHSLNLQTMKWPSREDQSGQNKTHYWVDWIIWIFTRTMTNIKLGQVKYNTLSADALAAVCLIEMGQNSIGPNNNKVRISMPFSLNLKKIGGDYFNQFIVEVPSFWFMICLHSWIRLYLPPICFWWQYIATATTHPLPILFLGQVFKVLSPPYLFM